LLAVEVLDDGGERGGDRGLAMLIE
jgi:hypothetical protein